MDPKLLASEIVQAGADKVLDRNPKRVDDAVVNTVIKQGANALESSVSKGDVDPAVGAAAEVNGRLISLDARMHVKLASLTLISRTCRRYCRRYFL